MAQRRLFLSLVTCQPASNLKEMNSQIIREQQHSIQLLQVAVAVANAFSPLSSSLSTPFLITGHVTAEQVWG
jgi:hypothetical protein